MRSAVIVLALILAVAAGSGCSKLAKAAFAVSVDQPTVARSTDLTGGAPVFTIRSDHTKTVTGVAVRIHLESLDGQAQDDRDIDLDQQPANLTGSDGVYTITSIDPLGTITIRPSAIYEPGRYRWTVTVNGDHALEEHTWTDNTASSLLTVTAATPPPTLDLSVGAPTSITGTDPLTLTVPVTVTGPSGAKAYAVRIDVYSEGRTTFRYHIYNYLTIGTHTLTITANEPAGGIGAIQVVVDPTEYITEADETNNVAVVDYPVTGGG